MIFTVKAESDEKEQFTWRVQLDIAFVSDPTELVGMKQKDSEDYLFPSLNLDLYYKGFFIKSDSKSIASRGESAEIGYQFYEGSNFELSILSKGYVTGFDENDIYSDFLEDEVLPELAGIESRLNSTMAGVRYLYFSSDSLFSFDIATGIDETAHEGWLLDTYYLYTYQYRNWDINAGIGATYLSDETNEYFYGVNEHESRSFRSEYSPDNGLIYTVELSAQRPVSSSWVFNIGVSVNHYSSSILNSPLVERDTVAKFKMSVGYVL